MLNKEKIPKEIRQKLQDLAIKKDGSKFKTVGYTLESNKLFFWYNTPDGSTRLVSTKVKTELCNGKWRVSHSLN